MEPDIHAGKFQLDWDHEMELHVLYIDVCIAMFSCYASVNTVV